MKCEWGSNRVEKRRVPMKSVKGLKVVKTYIQKMGPTKARIN